MLRNESNELGCRTNEAIHHFVSPTSHRSDERAKTTGTNFAFPYTRASISSSFSTITCHYAPNNKSIKATAHCSTTFNLGSGTRDTLHNAVRTRGIFFLFVYSQSIIASLSSLVYLPATSSQLPHSPRRVASKNLTLRRVSLSLSLPPLSAPLLSQRVVVRAP